MTPDIANKISETIGSDKVLVNLIHENDVPSILLFKIQSDKPDDISLCINVQIVYR